ncbi:hypothetical protein VV02_01955 [Luteipulveratus mongoliensis]|uniref:Uncharacterized protein n=1 Tax=Luteipulveratus mongoliensis TaxID=571913 RepID=A0A0K1JDY1_9MICO|nr:hypothetical protein VV02_01955 [Luteipulveratus mongoliensis]
MLGLTGAEHDVRSSTRQTRAPTDEVQLVAGQVLRLKQARHDTASVSRLLTRPLTASIKESRETPNAVATSATAKKPGEAIDPRSIARSVSTANPH